MGHRYLQACKQVFRCKLDRAYTLDGTQGQVIGEVQQILIDGSLEGPGRAELVRGADPLITLGDTRRRCAHWTRLGELACTELKPPPREQELNCEPG